jgi:hypothetical protein
MNHYAVIIAFNAYIMPFNTPLRRNFRAHDGTILKDIALFQVTTLLIMRWLSDRRFNNFNSMSIVAIVLHPVGFLYLFMIVIYAISHRLTGSGIFWKERLYTDKPAIQVKQLKPILINSYK